jgi:HAD superfamily hydrolase (TIGR01509 family)
MSNRIKGILFDLGDTLIDFGKVDVPTLFEAGAHMAYDYLTKLGKPLPAFANYHRRQLRAVRWNYFKSRITGREFNALDIMGNLSHKLGHDLSCEQTIDLAWQWYAPLAAMAKVAPCARDLLEDFKRQGLTVGLVSNTFIPGQVLDRHLAQAGLLELLPVRVYSCDCKWRKPSPDIFRLALKLAALAPGETLFVGDSPQADIVGANRAGMISVLKDPANRFANTKAKPAHRIKDLCELSPILRQYNPD